MTRPQFVNDTKPVAALEPGDMFDSSEFDLLDVVNVLHPPGEHVQVDVQRRWGGDICDLGRLAEVTGAESARWLGELGYPPLRYLLFYRPDADVTVVRLVRVPVEPVEAVNVAHKEDRS